MHLHFHPTSLNLKPLKSGELNTYDLEKLSKEELINQNIALQQEKPISALTHLQTYMIMAHQQLSGPALHQLT